MNKAEVKISTLVYTVIIAISALMVFSIITINFTNEYGREDLPEYQDYQTIFGEFNNTMEEIVHSQDQVNESDYEDLNLWQKGSKAIKDGYNVLTDNIIVRALKTILIPFKLIGSVANSLETSFSNMGFEVPSFIKWMILTLAAVSIIFAGLRAFWSKQI